MRDRGHRNSNERGGSADRRRRRQWLLNVFGDGTFAPCHEGECDTLVDLDTLHVDRILPAHQGGTYRRDNIRPHCPYHSRLQGARIRWELKKKAGERQPGSEMLVP